MVPVTRDYHLRFSFSFLVAWHELTEEVDSSCVSSHLRVGLVARQSHTHKALVLFIGYHCLTKDKRLVNPHRGQTQEAKIY